MHDWLWRLFAAVVAVVATAATAALLRQLRAALVLADVLRGRLSASARLVRILAGVNQLRLADALCMALEEQRAEAVHALLTPLADANQVSSAGERPLVVAAKSGSAPMVRLLLAAGADPDGLDAAGVSALCPAAAQGNTAVMEALIQAGATPDLPVKAVSPLIWAVAAGQVTAVGYLLRHGVARRDPSVVTQALECAQRREQQDIIEVLEPWTKPDEHNPVT